MDNFVVTLRKRSGDAGPLVVAIAAGVRVGAQVAAVRPTAAPEIYASRCDKRVDVSNGSMSIDASTSIDATPVRELEYADARCRNWSAAIRDAAPSSRMSCDQLVPHGDRCSRSREVVRDV
jgi:hypothetical protein